MSSAFVCRLCRDFVLSFEMTKKFMRKETNVDDDLPWNLSYIVERGLGGGRQSTSSKGSIRH